MTTRSKHILVGVSAPRPGSGLGARVLPLLILLAGAAHGFAARIVEAATVGGAGLFFGLSPFELLVVGVASLLLLEDDGASAPKSDTNGLTVWISIAAATALMIPSSAVAWGVVLAFGLWLAAHTDGAKRTGSLLFAGLAAVALFTSVGLRFVGAAITTVEASLVALLLSWFQDDVTRVGNVVGNPETFVLVILNACSNADGVPKAILAFLAFIIFLGRFDMRRVAVGLVALTAGYVVLNFVRLVVMASSADAYALAHGPVGATIFDVSVVTLLLLLGFWAARRNDQHLEPAELASGATRNQRAAS